MIRSKIEDLHVKRLATMCSQLDIGIDAYFDWATRFGYPFNSLVFEALRVHNTLPNLVRDRVVNPSNEENDIVVELLMLMT